MPSKSGKKTPQERAFVKYMGETGLPKYSAEKAGYKAPDVSACQLMQREGIRKDVLAVQLERMNNTLLPLAVAAIERLLTDKKTPAGAVVQAAKLVMDRTLGSDDANTKAPHEMTGEELARQLDRLRQEAAARSKPVIDGQVIEQKAQDAPNVLD